MLRQIAQLPYPLPNTLTMNEKQDLIPSEKRQEAPKNTVHVGQLKESDKKKLESDIAKSLQKLGKEMTHKEIQELIAVIDTSKNLASLKEKLEWLRQGGDEVLLKEILKISESIRKGAIEGIKELRVDVTEVLKNTPVELRKWVFLSEKFKKVGRFENSELGENIILDIGGFWIGALDSIFAIAKLLVRLLADLYRLPQDLLQASRNKS